MKFLLECVGCCMTSPSSGEYPTSEPSSPAASETRSLVASAETSLGRRRKRTPSRSAAADWRPSLYAISEDNAVPVGPENRNRPAQTAVKQAGSTNNVRRTCGNSSVRVNAHPRPHDFGHNPLPLVVPTFSAAPFMF